MSERTFDENVTDAADLLEDAYGLEEAIDELQRRREAGEDNGRVNEALAYLKRKREAVAQ
jgi:hypothetical protein